MRLRRYATVMTLMAGLVALTVAASAASLGGINNGDLFASAELDTVPIPIAYHEFDDCGGDLNGDLDVLGNAWFAPSTDWQCSASGWAENGNQNSQTDSATVDVSQSDLLIVTAYISRASRNANGAGSGLSLFHDGGSFHMYLVYQRGGDQIILGKVDGSGDTEIISWSWLPRTDTMELEVVISQPLISVYADGTLVGTHTMTVGELATFGSNTSFGMESDRDRRSRWDWFQVVDNS